MLASVLALVLLASPPEAATAAPSADAGAAATDAGDSPAPDGAPTEGASESEGEGSPSEVEGPALSPGTLTLAPTLAGQYQLYDDEGVRASEALELGEGDSRELSLAPGIYSIHGPAGVEPIVVLSGQELVWDGARLLPRARWDAQREEAAARAAAREAAAHEAAREAAAREAAAAHEGPPTPRWRAWASPLSSALIPGAGQFFNGQGGKGTALLFGSVGSVAAATALYTLANDGTRPAGAEYARLIGFGAFSSAAPLLWIYAIADAYRVAAKIDVEPKLDHDVRLSVNRMMTVGFRADANRPGFYDDWSVTIMGQAARRLSVGVADLSVKIGGVGGPQVWQFGVRADYRVFDRRRLWIDLALGSIFQVAVGAGARALDPAAPSPPTTTKFAAIPYGQLDLRYLVLSRLSLDLSPRLAVPVTTRYYSANRALPRYAPILELGVGVSTYF